MSMPLQEMSRIQTQSHESMVHVLFHLYILITSESAYHIISAP